MIKLPIKRQTDYSVIESEINSIRSCAGILDFYGSFINKYNELDAKYKFTEYFDKNFLHAQLENIFSMKFRPLFGMPFGIKDVFNTRVLPTTMGSEIWRGFKAGNNARIVDEIVDRGAIVFSKTTTAEFAVHYIDNNKTINPYNSKHITGTSSAGSAVAVACGALPIALGTQTAGSIIRPASFCNIFGFKPSFGAIDRTGVLKTTDSLDTIGFLGSDIYGLRKTFESTFQKEIENNYYAKKYFESYRNYRSKKQFKIGIISEQFSGYNDYESYVQDDFALFIKHLASPSIKLAMIKDIEFLNDIHLMHENIYCKTLAYYFEEEYLHGSGMSKIMSEMIAIGKKISKDDYLQALCKQFEYRTKFDSIMKGYDFLVTPSTASVAPVIGDRETKDTCLIWTFLGYPVLNLPIFWSDKFNLPYGLQIIGPKFSDLSLFDFGERILSVLADYSAK